MEIPNVSIDTQPLELTDFSGGVTDYYLGADPRKSKRLDNLLIVDHGGVGKLFTRQGSVIWDDDYYQIPAGQQRIASLKLFEDTLFIHSKEKLYYVDSGWQTLVGPTSNNIFPPAATVNYATSMTVWNHTLLVASEGFYRPQKIYKDGSGDWQLRTAGLPPLASNPTVTAGGAGTEAYVYAFCHAYTYTVGTITYLDRGPVRVVELTSAAAPNASTVSVAAIPTLSNGVIHNYATSSVKIEVYRTTSGGSTYYKVGQVTNGTATFSDSMSDATLQNQETLYTEGGVVENDPPPLCKFVHVVGDIAYYAHVKEGSEILSYRLMQSIAGDIDSVPVDFYLDIDDEITGLGDAKGAPILLTSIGTVYRVDGQFDYFGRGGMSAQKIGERSDCISGQSVVQTIDGLFWAGKRGIYFTDGYSVIRLNQEFDRTWATWVINAEQRGRIQGKYDAVKNRIWWTIQAATGVADCDKCYVLDLNWGIRPNATFTTASGGSNFAPTAIEFAEGSMYRADSRGYVFHHSDQIYTDPAVNVSVTPANWQTAVITYDWISAGFNFGTSFVRKFVPRIDVTAEDETNLSLQIISINDDDSVSENLRPIRSRGNLVWGEEDVLWGEPDLVWNREGIIDEQRRFPPQHLRCQYKQIQLTNAFVAIASSDQLGTATVNGVGKTATLDQGASFDWQSTIVDYFIAFSNDDFENEFLITERTSDDVLTFSDSGGLAPTNAGLEWVIRGYPRGEVLNLLAVTIHYSTFSKTQKFFKSAETGEPGA